MSRDTMVYYRSFRESLRELPPDLYKVVSETIFDYAFEGIAPGPDSNAVAKALFIAIKPVIDNAHNRYDACVENGRKGGAPKGSRNNPSGKANEPNQRPNQYPNQEPNLYSKYPLIPTLWMIFEDSTFAFRSGDKHRSRRIYGK